MDMFGPTIDRAEARRLLHQYAKSSKRRRLLFDEFLSLLCDYLRLAARCDHLVDRAFHHLEERQLQHKGGSAPQHQGLSASDVYQILCAEGPFQLSVEEAHEILDEFFPDEWRTTKQKIQPGMFADKIAFNLLHWVRAPDLFPGDENTYDDNNGNSRTNHANVAYMSSSQQPSHQYSGHSIKAGRSSSSSPPSSSVLSRTPRLTDPHKLPSNPSGEIIIRIMGMSNLHHFCRSKVRKDEGLAFYTIDPMLTVECDGITVRSTILLNQKTPKWNQVRMRGRRCTLYVVRECVRSHPHLLCFNGRVSTGGEVSSLSSSYIYIYR